MVAIHGDLSAPRSFSHLGSRSAWKKKNKVSTPDNPLRAAEGLVSEWFSVDDIVGQPLPVGFGITEPLSPSRQIFRRLAGAPTVELGDSSPFLKRINVRETHAGSLI